MKEIANGILDTAVFNLNLNRIDYKILVKKEVFDTLDIFENIVEILKLKVSSKKVELHWKKVFIDLDYFKNKTFIKNLNKEKNTNDLENFVVEKIKNTTI